MPDGGRDTLTRREVMVSRHNKDRRAARKTAKAEALARTGPPAAKHRDTRHWGYHDPEAGVSKHRETKWTPPWWVTDKRAEPGVPAFAGV